ncbi:unnamed protein product [Medioppia subpectinata]|uniref:F-box domain-containing protein n=1 Tax=Medioppia subpectinata TaxID=1979941 RepID=A0A7R9Q539_9ACAR|nr:unnamed protein product [Medioppia subpectinata]CAG2112352.1 unnamed protein product [Medioppia subpectinata]
MSQNLSMKTSVETKDDANQDIKQQPKLYARHSLDRFGDDLFGLLLTHLSLKDRFRLESVSKQFQRTVFGSVVDICIDDNLIANHLKTQILATIAIKCPNIRRLDCRKMTSEELIPEVMNAFGDHLRDIHCTLGPNGNQWLPTFGSLVNEIHLRDSSAKHSLIHCQRLSRLQIHALSNVFDTTSGQLLVTNLKRFDVQLVVDIDNQLLAAFVLGNQSLKSVSMHTTCDLRQLSAQLSRLPELRELTLSLFPMNDENLLAECLRKIGLNCKQLQRLAVKVVSNDFTLNGQTLDALRCYPQLKRLHFLHFVTSNDALTPLRFCRRLTHLTLESRRMNAELFKDCDKQCPRLQYLCVRTDTITGECFSHISRLPALKTLKMFFLNSLSDNDLCLQELLSRSTIVCNPVVIAINRALNRLKNRANILAKK